MRDLAEIEIDTVTGGITICVNHITADPSVECAPGARLNPPPLPPGNVPPQTVDDPFADAVPFDGAYSY